MHPRSPLPRAVLILSLTLAPAVPLAAQKLHLGLSTGVSRGTFGGDVEGSGHRTGGMAGLALGVEVVDGLELETGLEWIQKGARGRVQGFEEPARADHRLSYLEVPLVARLHLPGRGSLVPFLAGGASVAFEVGCDEDLRPTSEQTLPVSCHPDVARRAADRGALAGGGVEWRTGWGALRLEARYHHGLTDLEDRAGIPGTQNRALTLRVGASAPVLRPAPGAPDPDVGAGGGAPAPGG